MTKLRFPKDARLPFPTRIIQFIPKPSLDDEMYDIHADKKFIVKEFLRQPLLFREWGMCICTSTLDINSIIPYKDRCQLQSRF